MVGRLYCGFFEGGRGHETTYVAVASTVLLVDVTYAGTRCRTDSFGNTVCRDDNGNTLGGALIHSGMRRGVMTKATPYEGALTHSEIRPTEMTQETPCEEEPIRSETKHGDTTTAARFGAAEIPLATRPIETIRATRCAAEQTRSETLPAGNDTQPAFQRTPWPRNARQGCTRSLRSLGAAESRR